MKYRFKIPSTETNTTYRVSWEEVAHYPDTNSYVTNSMKEDIQGTGDPTNAVTGTEHEVLPPPWYDGAPGGEISISVENVSVTIVPANEGRAGGGGGGAGAGGGFGGGYGGGAGYGGYARYDGSSVGGGGCSSCGSGPSAAGGTSGQANSGGSYFQASMGQTTNGTSAGILSILAGVPSTNLASPALLSLSSHLPDVTIVLTNGQIRQVDAPQVLADVIVSNAYSYEIRFYSADEVGPQVGGLFQLLGTNPAPFVTWRIENPDGVASTNHLRITEIRGSDVNVTDYNYTNNSWIYSFASSLREDSTTTTLDPVNQIRQTDTVVRWPGGNDVLKVRRKYQQFSWGEAIVEVTYSPDANPRTTTYGYNPSPSFAPGGTFIPLTQVVHPDHSWEFYYYDSLGRITALYSGLADEAPPGVTGTPVDANCRKTTYDYSPQDGADFASVVDVYQPRMTIQYLQNSEIARSYVIIKPGERRDIQCQSRGAGVSATDNLVTITKNYTNGIFPNRVQSIEQPDGTLTFYQYVTNPDGTETDTIVTGAPNTGKTDVVDGNRTLTRVAILGQTLAITNVDIASTYLIASEVYTNFDDLGRAGRVTYLDGTHLDIVYSCCYADFVTNRDGVATHFFYDALKRQVASAVNGITTTNLLDPTGDVLQTTRIGTDNSSIILRETAFDLAGRAVSDTNALGGVTTMSEDLSTRRVVTTTYPDTGTRIETYFKDGYLQKVTGTAAFPSRFEYGYDGTESAAFTKETKLDGSGADTSEWTKNYSDMLGRSYKTTYPAASGTPASFSYYNSKGQLTNQVDPDGLMTIYQYSAKGEMEYTAQNLAGDGNIDWNADRISRSISDVAQEGTNIVRRQLTYEWPTTGVNTSILTGINEVSADGLRTWRIAYGLTNQASTVLGTSGYRYMTNIAPDGAYAVQVMRYGTNVSLTSFDSVGNQLSASTYSYDSQGMPNTATDARNGTTTTWFNNAGQPSGTLAPSPGGGQSAQVTTNFFDGLGRVLRTTLPDGTSVTNEYFVTGLLKKTYGSRTYPVEYSYDPQGRMKTMKTWQNFAANSGIATTTWNYDSYRGWLANKRYADNTGPSYAYTPGGRLLTRTWARGVVATYYYTSAGDLTEIDYSDATPQVSYSLDRRGRITTIEQSPNISQKQYDDAGNLLSERYTSGPLAGLTVTNRYDALLRRTTNGVWNGTAWITQSLYTYDSASRLAAVSDGTNSASYSYVANSPLVSQIAFTNNGVQRMVTTKSYDYLNRLTSIGSVAGGSNVSSFAYAYNSANQRTSVTNVDATRWVYTYDALGQVTSGKKYWSDPAGAGPVAGEQFQYSFDDIGNRKQTAEGGDQYGANLRYASYSANNLNQYTNRTVPGYVNMLGSAATNATVTLWTDNGLYTPTYRKADFYRGEIPVNNSTGALWITVTNLAVLNNGTNSDIITNDTRNAFIPQTAESFLYDADGNLIRDGRWTNTWDAENRLISMISLTNTPANSKKRLTFTYDSQWRRIVKKVESWSGSAWVTTLSNKFLYDDWNLVAELNGTNNATIRSYTWGIDLSGTIRGAGGVGGLLAINAPAEGMQYASFDGSGNLVALTRASDGAESARYDYSPFGNVISAQGVAAQSNPIRFSTKYMDEETEELYYGYRYYSPTRGNWLSRDPIEEFGAKNILGFNVNNPVSFADICGLGSVPMPPDPARNACCAVLIEFLKQLARHVRGRYNDLLADKLFLYKNDPVGWQNHLDKFDEQQRRLNRWFDKIKDKCPRGPGGGLDVPPWVSLEQYREAPDKPLYAERGFDWTKYVPGSPAALQTAGDIALITAGVALAGAGVGLAVEGGIAIAAGTEGTVAAGGGAATGSTLSTLARGIGGLAKGF